MEVSRQMAGPRGSRLKSGRPLPWRCVATLQMWWYISHFFQVQFLENAGY